MFPNFYIWKVLISLKSKFLSFWFFFNDLVTLHFLWTAKWFYWFVQWLHSKICRTQSRQEKLKDVKPCEENMQDDLPPRRGREPCLVTVPSHYVRQYKWPLSQLKVQWQFHLHSFSFHQFLPYFWCPHLAVQECDCLFNFLLFSETFQYTTAPSC